MKRTLSILLCALLLFAIPFNMASGEDLQKITFWATSDITAQVDAAKQVFATYYPGVEVEATYFSAVDIRSNCKIAASSNTLPDIWTNWGGNIGSFYADNGLCYDLTEIAKTMGFSDIFLPHALEKCMFSGKLQAIPSKVSVYTFIYYKPAFEAAGWANKKPGSFEEFEQLLIDLKDAGYTPIAVAGKGGWHVMRFIEYLLEYYCGSDLLDDMLTLNASWNNEGALAAMSKYKEYSDLGYYPDGFVTAEPNNARMLLYSGIAAITIGSVAELNAITREGFDINDFGIMTFPGQNGVSRVDTGANLYQFNANSSAEMAAACVTFALCMDSLETREILAAEGNSTANIAHGTRFDSIYDNDLIAYMQNDLATYGGMTLIDQALPSELADQWFIVQDSVGDGTMTPEEGLQFFDKAISVYKGSH